MSILINICLLLILSFWQLHAAPMTKDEVPEPLKPWVDWVLYDQDEQMCSHAYNSDRRFCAWPSSLELALNNKRGAFSQAWSVKTEVWVRLPGNGKQWPHEVKLDGVPVVVIKQKGFPVVKLTAGEHEITGNFQWDSIPESLTIPPATGLVKIKRDGEDIAFPRINQQGQLWLDKSLQEKSVQDSLDVQIYRKISDGHPLQVETRLILNVSGRSRDVVFPKIQLDDFIPLSLKSRLPARVNQQGDLQIQVRPGNWEINLTSYHPDIVESLSLTRNGEGLPTQELWVFQAHPALRLTEISGAPAVDSRQTRLPQDWHRFPAYLVDVGKTMQIKTLQRGSASPEPNRLSLKRQMWMDFDGEGFTIKDAIQGTMTKGWRLVVAPEMELGSVRIDNEPQFITVLDKGEDKGIEVRRGQIALEAASRYTESVSMLPVTGWQHDFQKVSTSLYLPPGWKLFSAHGADNLPNTWLQSWTLLDLFMVLIIAVAIGRLWGWKWGVFALVTMALIWHEPGAPKLIWLNLLAAIALLRALPEGLMKKLLWWYRNATLLALLLIMIPFIVSEVRNGLYPQLGLYADYDAPSRGRTVSTMMAEESLEMADMASSRISKPNEYDQARKKMTRMDKQQKQVSKNTVNQMVDPNANIQTGPGLPSWDWQQVHFQWNSPVDEAQTLRLNFISPGMNMLLNFLRVMLLLVLIARLLRGVTNSIKPGTSGKQGETLAKAASILLLPVLIGAMWNQEVYAEDLATQNVPPVAQQNVSAGQAASQSGFPDSALLKTLQERLLVKRECLPECAQIESMQMHISEQQLTVYLKVHVSAEVAIPLPGQSEQWRPDHVLMANQPIETLSRDERGNLWLGLTEGIHDVVMQGRLPKVPQLQLSLPLLPKYVSWQGTGWTVEGIRENYRPSQQLQLIRTKDATSGQEQEDGLSDSNILPPLLHVERTLFLGLDWLVETKVIRLSPVGSPISMKIPLLGNESVMTNAFPVKDGHVVINFSSTQRSVNWQSQIPVSEQLVLEAVHTQGLVESWKLDISSIWHVTIEGISTIHQGDQNDMWLPEWQPWPGEKVTLAVTRPEGIKGRTLTIDRSILSTSVGKRVRETTLALNMRSSRGGQHAIKLPPDAELISVSINNKVQPVRQQQGQLSLPIVPGQQRIEVKWRVNSPISAKLNVLPVDVGVDNVNNSINLRMGRDRWVLFANGPQMGPAVLFWGVLLVVLLGAIILGRIKDSPLRTWQWFLLGVGLSLATPFMMIVVVTWLLAMKYRPQLQHVKSKWVFNSSQVLLVLLTLVALGSLLITLQQGLLGWPDMQIRGNQSSAWGLRWYQDRAEALLPQPWVISVPLMVYRVLMLLWALWLAFSLISWLRQGWENFTIGGLWRPREVKAKKNAESEVEGKAEDS
ncbi:MAG: Unknown protein [uncultured Thiotrichaceae bacterium]|uniref:Uncharacterized protein n=1 Tax=uncultured Thiotrichaceae bacterium TaxID=298394 RepID=A0A6S6S1L0_9GAMM|nr:MAG: Unknown protein [uncultured Thiotrichaceae bacterium]